MTQRQTRCQQQDCQRMPVPRLERTHMHTYIRTTQKRNASGSIYKMDVGHTHTHTTHTHTFNDLFQGLPGWADTRKVKPIWILLKQETVSGNGISCAICYSATHSWQITVPAPHHSVFTGPSSRPTNSVKVLKAYGWALGSGTKRAANKLTDDCHHCRSWSRWQTTYCRLVTQISSKRAGSPGELVLAAQCTFPQSRGSSVARGLQRTTVSPSRLSSPVAHHRNTCAKCTTDSVLSAVTTSDHYRPTQPPILCGMGNEHQPKCGNALQLKGRSILPGLWSYELMVLYKHVYYYYYYSIGGQTFHHAELCNSVNTTKHGHA